MSRKLNRFVFLFFDNDRSTLVADKDRNPLRQICLLAKSSENTMPVPCYLFENFLIRLESNSGAGSLGIPYFANGFARLATVIFLLIYSPVAFDFHFHVLL